MVLVARTANAFLESALLPAPSGRPKAPKVIVAEPVAMLNLEKLAKATGLKVPEPEPVAAEAQGQQADLTSPPVRSSLRVKLLGTAVSSIPELSIASIQDVVTLKTATYLVDDLIQGAKVLEIEREKVIVLNNGRREFIDGTPGDGSAMAVAPPPVVATPPSRGDGAPPSVALGTGIKSTGENEYEIPRGEIDKTLSNLNDVAMQARIVPAFKDGVAQGFKLFSIRPDSIYSKIGIQNGDVIKRINGYDLNSPEKALEIYSKLKEASRIDIEVDRNGSAVRKTYNVR